MELGMQALPALVSTLRLRQQGTLSLSVLHISRFARNVEHHNKQSTALLKAKAPPGQIMPFIQKLGRE
jgi:hypothetical protein